MALFFEGKSQCALCGSVIEDVNNVVLFPPLTSNMKEPLYIFSDNPMHATCLEQHPLREKALTIRQMYHDSFLPGNRRCLIDGSPITSYEDTILINLLTSSESEELYRYNFKAINKSNLVKWQERHELIRLLKKFLQEGKWKPFHEFNLIEYLIGNIEATFVSNNQ